MFQRLLPGEKFEGFTPSRPNSNIDAFMRYMLREVAAGVGVSYETLSRDYSQSNYSSSRLALLDDRDQWRVLQTWLIEKFLKPIFCDWLDHAVLSGRLNLPDISKTRNVIKQSDLNLADGLGLIRQKKSQPISMLGTPALCLIATSLPQWATARTLKTFASSGQRIKRLRNFTE